MIRSINYCFQNKKVVSIHYDDRNSPTHLVGYIVRFNENEILLAHISPHGYYDGFILKRIEDIQRISYGGEYENTIEKLYKLKNQTHPTIDSFNPDDDEILFSLIDFASDNNLAVTLEFEEDNVSGFLNGYSDDVIYVSVINDYGEEDGISIIHIDAVLSYAVDTDHEQNLRILYDNREEKPIL